jgi:hypothetical protein
MKRVFIEIDVPTLEAAEALRDHLLNEVTIAEEKMGAKLVDSGIQDEPFGPQEQS